MQKKKNKVAKSAWKFLKTNLGEIYKYASELKLIKKQQGKQSIGFVENNHLINTINYTFRCFVYLGKYSMKKRFSVFSIKSKVGQFLKYTKPFHYISKKKKKKINVKKN